MNELAGIKESDTGLAVPSLWDLPADKQALQSEEPLQVINYILVGMSGIGKRRSQFGVNFGHVFFLILRTGPLDFSLTLSLSSIPSGCQVY